MNISRELANKLISESPSFRHFILDIVYRLSESDQLREVVLHKMKSLPTAIERCKYLRSLKMADLQRSFPDFTFTLSDPDKPYISLASAKYFSDKYS